MSLTLNTTSGAFMGLADTSNWMGSTSSLALLDIYYTSRTMEPYSLRNVTYWSAGNADGKLARLVKISVFLKGI